MEVAAVVLIPKDVPVVKTLVAQTESPRAVDIVARISGFLDGIAYAEGQLVQESQVLFQLDQKPFPAHAAGSELKQQARSWTARASYKRIKPLAAENAVSQCNFKT